MTWSIWIPVVTYLITGTLAGQSGPAILWQRTLGGSEDDAISTLQLLTDGCLLTGYAESADGDVTGQHGSYDGWVVRTDSEGGIIWQRTLGGSSSDGAGQFVLLDSTFIVAGSTQSTNGDASCNHGYSDVWVLEGGKNDGSVAWTNCYGGTWIDVAGSMCRASNGNYVLAGETGSNDGDVTNNHGNKDVWVLEIDPQGALQWQRTFGGSAGDYASEVVAMPDGGIAISGASYSSDQDVAANHGDRDGLIVRCDVNGDVLWYRLVGGSEGDSFSSLQATGNNGIIAVGSTHSTDGDIAASHGGADVWVVRLDAAGELLWQRTYGGSDDEYAAVIRSTGNGGYAVAGNTRSRDGDVSGVLFGGRDAWVFQVDANGELIWQRTLGGSIDDDVFDLQETPDGSLVMAGCTFSNDGDVAGNHGHRDAWLVKLAAYVPPIVPSETFSVSPVPTEGSVLISCPVYQNNSDLLLTDLAGRTVLRSSMTGYTESMDLTTLAPGAYVVTLKMDGATVSRKVTRQ